MGGMKLALDQEKAGWASRKSKAQRQAHLQARDLMAPEKIIDANLSL
jgi:hypothetical protein